MKIKIKLWVRIITVLFTALLIQGCTGEIKTTADITSDSKTITTENNQTLKELKIIDNGMTDYTIIIPKSSKKYVRNTANMFRDTLKLLTGVTISVCDDSNNAATGAVRSDKEILFGTTNREDEVVVDYDVFVEGYSISVQGKRLVIASNTQSGLYFAVRQIFIDLCDFDIAEGNTGKSIDSFTVNTEYSVTESLSSSVFPFMNTALSDYRIVYNGSDFMQARYAVRVSIAVEEVSGKPLACTTNQSGGNGVNIFIDVDDSINAGDYKISVSGTSIKFSASTYYGFEGVFAYLESYATENNGYYDFKDGFTLKGNYKDTVGTLTESTAFAYEKGENIRIMSYNVLWGHPDVGARNVLQAKMAGEYLPDVIGFQECDNNNRTGNTDKNIMELFKSLGYSETMDPAIAAHQRKVNVCPILYNEETTELIDTGYVIYNAQAENSEMRMLTWAIFSSAATGERYIVVNTHLEGGNVTIGLEQVKEIEACINELIKTYKETPIFLIGDFNFVKSSNSYKYIVDTAEYVHIRDLTKKYSSVTNSVNSYPVYNSVLFMMQPGGNAGNDPHGNNSFDQIFLANGDVTISVYGVVVDECTLSGSDHFPIFVDFTINKEV